MSLLSQAATRKCCLQTKLFMQNYAANFWGSLCLSTMLTQKLFQVNVLSWRPRVTWGSRKDHIKIKVSSLKFQISLIKFKILKLISRPKIKWRGIQIKFRMIRCDLLGSDSELQQSWESLKRERESLLGLPGLLSVPTKFKQLMHTVIITTLYKDS